MTRDLTLDDCPVPRDDLVVHVLDGEAVVFSPGSGDLHHLDAPATLVWQLLEPGAPLRQTVADIAESADAPAAEVEADVLRLTAQLLERGLVTLDRTSSVNRTTRAAADP